VTAAISAAARFLQRPPVTAARFSATTADVAATRFLVAAALLAAPRFA
jgi:hypothetical protein